MRCGSPHGLCGWALAREPVGMLTPLCLNESPVSEPPCRRGRPSQAAEGPRACPGPPSSGCAGERSGVGSGGGRGSARHLQAPRCGPVCPWRRGPGGSGLAWRPIQSTATCGELRSHPQQAHGPRGPAPPPDVRLRAGLRSTSLLWPRPPPQAPPTTAACAPAPGPLTSFVSVCLLAKEKAL